jgi:hypothetical protein
MGPPARWGASPRGGSPDTRQHSRHPPATRSVTSPCCVTCCVAGRKAEIPRRMVPPQNRCNTRQQRKNAMRPARDCRLQPHSKSVARKGVWVQVPPPALLKTRGSRSCGPSWSPPDGVDCWAQRFLPQYRRAGSAAAGSTAINRRRPGKSRLRAYFCKYASVSVWWPITFHWPPSLRNVVVVRMDTRCGLPSMTFSPFS